MFFRPFPLPHLCLCFWVRWRKVSKPNSLVSKTLTAVKVKVHSWAWGAERGPAQRRNCMEGQGRLSFFCWQGSWVIARVVSDWGCLPSSEGLLQSENIQERKHTTNSHTPSSKSYQWSHWLRKDKVRSLPQNIFFAMTEPTHKKILFPPHEKHLVLLSSFVPRALLNLADWRADLKSNPQWHLLFFSKLPRSGL